MGCARRAVSRYWGDDDHFRDSVDRGFRALYFRRIFGGNQRSRWFSTSVSLVLLERRRGARLAGTDPSGAARTGPQVFRIVTRDSCGARIGPLPFLSSLPSRCDLAVFYSPAAGVDSRHLRRIHQNEIARALALGVV